MPKIVDHDKQRLLVAEAAWRVIRRDGMEQASVRNIALEAGISAGSMRHYFSTQSELLLYAMNLVSERVSNRITQMSFDASPLENMKLLLLELLPSTDERPKWRCGTLLQPSPRMSPFSKCMPTKSMMNSDTRWLQLSPI
ncbi:TetR/AcrR family transcriptional regulator [Paenibacillus taichungensis]|uniref:TetR/AcrR family transcriptional regulator n=1 Tax=Paenibacillus taichungensis TaxID=484184 RepID=UPI003D9A5DC0